MSIRLVGELLTPISCPMSGVTIHLKALDTSASVLFSSEASVKTDYKGRYEFTVPTGLYLVSLDNGISSAELGQIQVYSDSTESTLQALLDAPQTEPSPIWLQQLEEKVTEATKQAGIATNAAGEATTAAKTVSDNVDAAKQHADRAYASATNAAKSEASAGADAVSAEESAVRAEEAAAISQSIGVVNPNLFINCDGRLIQRAANGELVYGPIGNGAYGVDRWRSIGTNNTMRSLRRSDAVDLPLGSYSGIQSYKSQSSPAGNGWRGIEQRVLSSRSCSLRNGKATVSGFVCLRAGIGDLCLWVMLPSEKDNYTQVITLVSSKSLNIPEDGNWHFFSHTFDCPDGVKNGISVQISSNGSSTDESWVAFTAMKLEKGSVATACVADSTTLNTVKCKRYFNKIIGGISWSYLADFSTSRNSFGLSSKGFQFLAMRDVPVVSIDVNMALDAVTGSTDKSLVRCISSRTDGVTISHPVNVSSSALKSTYGYIYLNSISLDAEI